MMPPHDVYIEPFLGSGAIVRRKRPAEVMTYAYELNPKTIDEFVKHLPDGWSPADFGDPELSYQDAEDVFDFADEDGTPRLQIRNTDGVKAIQDLLAASSGFWAWNDPARTVVYADPPYPRDSRSSKSAIYQFEMFEQSQHRELLDFLAAVPCKVMISSYANPLYNSKLKNWRTEEIPTVNRAGDRVIETVYLNFPEPFELHDYEHVGTDYRDRWRIEKKARNWERNLFTMPALERYAILGRLNDRRKQFAQAEADQAAQAAADRERIAKRREREQRPTPAAALGSREQDLF